MSTSLDVIADAQKENNKYIKRLYYLEEKKFKLEEQKRLEYREKRVAQEKYNTGNIQLKKARHVRR